MQTDLADEGTIRARPRAMVKPLLILLLVVALVMGAIFGWHMFIGKMIGKSMSGMASAPQTVSTAVAVSTNWQSRTQALGTVRAVHGADLAAQAAGVVDKIHFDSGTEVPAGATLLTLKPNDDPAKLAQFEAQAELSAITLKRDREQLQSQAISQATVDADASNLKSARAQVAAQQALIDEKTVRAPFAGKLGIRQVDEGQYLAAGTTVVTLQALDPIYIDFYLPQQTLSRLKAEQTVTATVDSYPGTTFTGTITAISSKVDATSRNVQARASFANADRKLVPGMYATVEIDNGDGMQRITVPQSAITYNPYGDTVYVLQRGGADNGGAGADHGSAGADHGGTTGHGGENGHAATVIQRFVKLGDTRGDQVAVTSGLASGEEVVTAGQVKLRNGASVIVNNTVLPTDNPNPTPPNE